MWHENQKIRLVIKSCHRTKTKSERQSAVDFKYQVSSVLICVVTDGTIYSWGLRVAFLSNPDAVVAG